METILEFLLENIYWIKLGTIPIVAGLIGCLANWLYVRSLFNPQNIQARNIELAKWNAELLTTKLLTANEFFDRLDPEEITQQMQPQMRKLAEKVVDHAMDKKASVVWKRLPDRLKRAVYDRTAADIPNAITAILEEFQTGHDQLIDLKKMYTEALLHDPNLLVELYKLCSRRESVFFIGFGWWFGLLLGIGQMLAWYFYPEFWILPVIGALIGLITNGLAWMLIFSPGNGHFIKRKAAVSEIYADVIALKVLTSERLWEFMLDENKGDTFYALLEKHVDVAMRNLTAGTMDSIANTLAPQQFQEARDFMVKDIAFRLPASFRAVYSGIDRTLNIQPLLKERLFELVSYDFVDILRLVWGSAWRPVLHGLIVGGLAGFGLWVLLFEGWRSIVPQILQ